MTRCEFSKDDGTPCGARPLHGGRFCFFHEPTQSSRRQAARQAGGRGKPPPPHESMMPKVDLKSPCDINRLLADTIRLVCRGQMAPKVANTIGYLVNISLRVLDQENVDLSLKILNQFTVGYCPSWAAEDDFTLNHLIEAPYDAP